MNSERLIMSLLAVMLFETAAFCQEPTDRQQEDAIIRRAAEVAPSPAQQAWLETE